MLLSSQLWKTRGGPPQPLFRAARVSTKPICLLRTSRFRRTWRPGWAHPGGRSGSLARGLPEHGTGGSVNQRFGRKLARSDWILTSERWRTRLSMFADGPDREVLEAPWPEAEHRQPCNKSSLHGALTPRSGLRASRADSPTQPKDGVDTVELLRARESADAHSQSPSPRKAPPSEPQPRDPEAPEPEPMCPITFTPPPVDVQPGAEASYAIVCVCVCA